MSTPKGSSSPFIRKPLAVVHRQELEQQESFSQQSSDDSTCNTLQRHLTLGDLIGIGVGSTVGSGIFVLTGQIASDSAGPSTFISFAIAGSAAACSAFCYAELSARIPAAGSTYVYAYVCLGEWAAVLAAACLTLEYGVAGAAVSRTWGDKLIEWFSGQLGWESAAAWLEPGGVVNIPAMFVAAGSTALLLAGVQESKTVTNWVTALKMAIVVFMTVAGFCLFKKENMGPPLAPYGVSGVLRGATSSFFGYLGYDEVCCVAGEAIHPTRDMPLAVLGTLGIVTVCYVLAALALTGMVPYQEISPTSGFPGAFWTRGVRWAGQLTALGEIATLPVVVLISLLAQPRLTFGMAQDGLLPPIFRHVDETGNLRGGTAISGIIMTVVATFVPFTYLNDLISAGILVAFSMTNACLVLLRCESPMQRPMLLEKTLVVYNALCFMSAMLSTHTLPWLPAQNLFVSLLFGAAVYCLFYMANSCPASQRFGGSIIAYHPRSTSSSNLPSDEPDSVFFRTPCVPYLPAAGMAINWYLIAQLDAHGIYLLLLYMGVTLLLYSVCCAPYSVGHNHNWGHSQQPHNRHPRGNYHSIQQTDPEIEANLPASRGSRSEIGQAQKLSGRSNSFS